jgi:transposase
LGQVFEGPERRRRWTTEDKLRILAQASAPGSSPTLTCRLNGISTGQLSTWRRQFRQGELTGFVPVAITPEPMCLPPPETVAPEPAPGPGGVIVVELPTGVKVRVTGDVGEAALRRVLAALS